MLSMVVCRYAEPESQSTGGAEAQAKSDPFDIRVRIGSGNVQNDR